MKTLICIILALLYVTCVASHGIRVKRGLSSDKQKKLLDTLNADRKAVGKKLGIKFETLTYDTELEKEAEAKTCSEIIHDKLASVLKLNNFGREENEKVVQKRGFNYHTRPLFHPEQTKIGCWKEAKCSHTITKEDQMDDYMGKTIAFSGACFLRQKKEH